MMNILNIVLMMSTAALEHYLRKEVHIYERVLDQMTKRRTKIEQQEAGTTRQQFISKSTVSCRKHDDSKER